MSSFVRRIEIRVMKRAGYTREKWIIRRDPSGQPKVVNVRRGGEITDPDDAPIGRLWPNAVPKRAQPPKREIKTVAKPPRGRRRGKRSKRWVEARKVRSARETITNERN